MGMGALVHVAVGKVGVAKSVGDGAKAMGDGANVLGEGGAFDRSVALIWGTG